MLLLLCLFLFFWRLGIPPLFDLDEALYVSCARQMVLRGDMVTPRLNSHPLGRPNEVTSPFYEKPIMVYWAPAFSMKIFGISELAARIPSAMAALLTTLIVYLAGRRWFSRNAGLFAAAVYASCPMTIADARQMTTDGLLTLWFSLAMFSFWEITQPSKNTPAQQSVLPTLLFWISCGLAMLSKGVVGILLPSIVIIIYGIANHKLNPEYKLDWQHIISRLKIPIGILILIALVLPWHILIWKAGGHDAQGRTFVQEYLLRQHIGRFRGLDTVHNAPSYTFFAYFLIGFFPWSCFTSAAFKASKYLYSGGDESISGRKFHFFLLVWFWTIFIFFSLGAAKLPTYIVPLYPAAALMVGKWAEMILLNQKEQSLFQNALKLARQGGFAVVICSLLLSIAVFFAPRLTPAASPIPNSVLSLIQILTMLLLFCSSIAWLLSLFGKAPMLRIAALVHVLMITALTGIGCTYGYTIAKSEIMGPYQRLAKLAGNDAALGVPVVYYHIIPRRPSMLFYSEYSPFEMKDYPLLPSLPSGSLDCDVITSCSVYRELLLPELSKQIKWEVNSISNDGDPDKGWVLLHLKRNNSN